MNTPKKVTDYLNEINYAELENYKPSEAALELTLFIQMVENNKVENKTPAVHLYAIDIALKDFNPTAIMCFRGFGKTALFGEYLILFIAAFGRYPGTLGEIDFAIYLGDSIENGVKSLRNNIQYRYNNSKYLQNLIPDMNIKFQGSDGSEEDTITAGRKFTDVRMEFVNKRGNHFVLRMYGAKSGIRGAKELGKRPRLAIIDDIVSDEDARSDTIIKTIEDTVHKALKYALHPSKSKIIWLGTPFNANDPLYKAVESGAYSVACFPVCEKFPISKTDFRGAWEDRFNYYYVKGAYYSAKSLGRIDTFRQEMMLEIIDDENRLVNDNDIVWFNRDEILKNKHNYNFYITTDFATSEKSNSDYSVISVWAINNNKDYMLVDGICEKQLVDRTITDLFRLVTIYNPLGVGIEISGQQKGFISWINSEMINKNIYFTLLSSNNNGEEGIRPIKDKFTRFNLFLPRFKMKKIWFANELKNTKWMNECLDELSKASQSGFKSKHDDVLDTISMLGSFEVFAPTTGYIDPKINDRFYSQPLKRNTVF